MVCHCCEPIMLWHTIRIPLVRTSPFHFHCCEPIMLWHTIRIPLYVPVPSISTAVNPSCYDTPSGYPCTYQSLPFPLLWTHHVMTHHQDTPVRTSPFHFHCCEPIMLWHTIRIPLYVPVPSISTAMNPSCYDTPSGYPCTYQSLPFPLLWTHHVMTHHQDRGCTYQSLPFPLLMNPSCYDTPSG